MIVRFTEHVTGRGYSFHPGNVAAVSERDGEKFLKQNVAQFVRDSKGGGEVRPDGLPRLIQ